MCVCGEKKEPPHQKLSCWSFHAECPASDISPLQGGSKRKLRTSRWQTQEQGALSWHLWLWKLLEQQFTKLQDPFILRKIILPSPFPCAQGSPGRGLDYVDVTLVTCQQLPPPSRTSWHLCLFNTHLLFK